MRKNIPAGVALLTLGALVWSGLQLQQISSPSLMRSTVNIAGSQENLMIERQIAEIKSLEQQLIELVAWSPSMSAVAHLPEPEIEQPQVAKRQSVKPAAEPPPTLTLVYLSDDFRRATIDGEVVQEGARVGRNWRVARIETKGVVLMRAGQRLFLPAPESGTVAGPQVREVRL